MRVLPVTEHILPAKRTTLRPKLLFFSLALPSVLHLQDLEI
ncbi:hypothetical protein M3J09_005480 [Ascochyta lentis]